MSQSVAKPCPWCGEDPGNEGDIDDRDRQRRVVCGSCGMGGPWGRSSREAMRKWNTRPIEERLQQEIDELRPNPATNPFR